ncbi:hypothetical protein YC2023_053692 [Brassica napus]
MPWTFHNSFSMLNKDIDTTVDELGIPTELLPICYLRFPLTTHSLKKADYEPLIDGVRSRMIIWSIKLCSLLAAFN